MERDSIADEAMILLETGAPAPLIDLAVLTGTSLTRAEYLSLHEAGLFTPAAGLAADRSNLEAHLGAERVQALLERLTAT